MTPDPWLVGYGTGLSVSFLCCVLFGADGSSLVGHVLGFLVIAWWVSPRLVVGDDRPEEDP